MSDGFDSNALHDEWRNNGSGDIEHVRKLISNGRIDDAIRHAFRCGAVEGVSWHLNYHAKRLDAAKEPA